MKSHKINKKFIKKKKNQKIMKSYNKKITMKIMIMMFEHIILQLLLILKD